MAKLRKRASALDLRSAAIAYVRRLSAGMLEVIRSAFDSGWLGCEYLLASKP